MKLNLKNILKTSPLTMKEMYKTYVYTIKNNYFINEYLNKIPLDNQITFLTYPTEEMLYGGMAGGGKALDINTKIPTINGFKKMKDIKVGDIVFTEKGEPTPVLAISPIYYNHKCYKLDFKTVSIVCDEGHIWNVKPVKHNQYPFKNYTTKELVKIDKKLKVPKSEIVKYNNKLNLPSYTLGAWLGDGNSYHNGFATEDKEILEYIEEEGFTVKKWSGKYEYGIYGLHTILRKNNLLKNKHIPQEYFTACYEDKLNIIQGLMDTNGNITKNGKCEFVQKNYNIVNGLRSLLASLGIKCNIIETFKKAQTIDKPNKYYKLMFYTTLPVFRLLRKKERLPKQVKQSYTETIININEVESRPTKCIKVANPNGLYLVTEQFIPTHNSEALLLSALQYVDEKFIPPNQNKLTYDALILRRTLDDLEMPNAILDRAKQWLLPLEDTGLVHYRDLKKRFTFSSGATLTFRYLAHNNDLNKFQGAELQFIGIDELTQFPENQYNYLHSRLRKTEDNPIPLRMRGASNPGGIGHDWVKAKFITGDAPFIPSSYLENKYLNQEEYSKQLDKLDPLTKQQLKYGDWNAVVTDGLLINRDRLEQNVISISDELPVFSVIGIDPASKGSDRFSMCCLTLMNDGLFVVTDLLSTPTGTPEQLLREFIIRNLKYNIVLLNFEREPGSSSEYALRYWNNVLSDLMSKYNISIRDTPASGTGSKFERARPHANSVRENKLFFNEELLTVTDSTGYNYLESLFNQYVYVHPDKNVMKDFSSPDELDSLGYAYIGLKDLLERRTSINVGRGIGR